MRVLVWRCFCDLYGSWGKAARHYKIKKAELQRYVLDDLETIWGEPIDWSKAFDKDEK